MEQVTLSECIFSFAYLSQYVSRDENVPLKKNMVIDCF